MSDDLLTQDALTCPAVPASTDPRDYAQSRTLLAPDVTLACPADEPSAALSEPPPLRPDDVVAATLVERVIDLFGLEATPELRKTLIGVVYTAIQQALPAYPGARPDPDGPLPEDALIRTLRGALGYSAAGMPSLEEARRLADLVVSGITQMLGVSAGDLRRFASQAGLPLSIAEDTDADDPLFGFLRGLFEESDPPDPLYVKAPPPPAPDDPLKLQVAQAGVGVPGITMAVLQAVGVARLRALMKRALPQGLRAKVREFARSKAALGPNTSKDGLLAEGAIRLAYMEERGAAAVLAGTRVGSLTIGDMAAADPLWSTIRTGLISFLSGRVGAPDILDADLGHVYEIKPMRRAVEGAEQLYFRYLFWLNLAELGASNVDVKPLELAEWAVSMINGSPAPPFPLAGRTPAPPSRVWVPGPWRPKEMLPLPDKRMIKTEVPIPGVICYEVLGKDSKQQQEAPAVAPSPEDLAKMVMAMAIAWAIVQAGERAAPGKGVTATASWFKMPALPDVDAKDVATVALVAAGVIVTVALVVVAAPIVLPAIGAAVEAFLAGGTLAWAGGGGAAAALAGAAL
jgi:hypothetical protein